MFKRAVILAILCCASVLVSAAGPCDLDAFCTADQAIECIRSVNFDKSYYKEAIDDIVKSIEPYVYLDILKNPPQPEGFPNYFEPVDLVSELKAIKTDGINSFYDFYRTVQGLLMRAKDGHFGFSFDGNDDYDNKLYDFYFTLPVELYADTTDEGDPIMKGALIDLSNMKIDLYEKIPNGKAIQDLIEKNADVAIASINDMDPFDFVLNFASDYYNFLKNDNARYTYASQLVTLTPPIYFAPLDPDDFNNFTVVYANGDKLTSAIQFVNLPVFLKSRKRDVSSANIANVARKLAKDAPFGKPFGLKDVLKAVDAGEAPTRRLTEKEVAETIKKVTLKRKEEKIRKITLKEKEEKTRASTSIWDYEDKDKIYKCKADKENKVNVFVVTSFMPDDVVDFVNVHNKCFELINENTYPIIVVTDNNGGGYVALSYYFQESLQPDMTARTFYSFKADDTTRKAMGTIVKEGSYSDPETCKTYKKVDELMEGTVTDTYGNGVTHTRTKPVYVGYSSMRKDMDKDKEGFKVKRKPTEIVVFTDSYSFSASSVFTKGMKEAGAAIMVGYNGYPGSTAESFDIGQAPTNVLQGETLMLFNPDEYSRLLKKGITYAGMSFGETFRVEDIDSKKASPTPRDFLVDPADERVPFYGPYVDEIYDVVVEAGKEILTKYETYCNPNNPKLHMRNEGCDAIINKTHMHGGYTCGADGKWSTTCEGYYCDMGYYFDTYTKECVVDPCAKSFSSSISFSIVLMFFIVFALF